jgi:hypothetical protein
MSDEPPIDDAAAQEYARKRAAIEAARDLVGEDAYRRALRDLEAARTPQDEARENADRAERRMDDEAIQKGKAALDGAEVVNLGEVREAKAKGGARAGSSRRKKASASDVDDAPEEPRIYTRLNRPRIDDKGHRVYVPVEFLAADCPVQPLGYDRKVRFFLNPGGQLIELAANEFGQAHLMGLFGERIHWLNREFPQIDQWGNWKGFQAQYVAMALITQATKKGVFDARDKVRGLGCWKDREGKLVQHVGDGLVIQGQTVKPGEVGGYVYPGRPEIGRADNSPVAVDLVNEVYSTFHTWNFARGSTDARLLIGFIGCAILGGALDWRPMVFITGDAGTGKSTLMDRLKAMLPGRLVSTVDATPAALRNIINQDSVGVLFDEIEADALSESAQHVMKLARIAASGGTSYRAHNTNTGAAEFTLRGCFAFSAIVPPSMRGQDMQRLAFLRLQPLPAGQKLPKLTSAQAEALGNALVGRITSAWTRFGDTLEIFRNALEKQGHDQRSATQFGTLLAAADLILEDVPADATSAEFWAEKLPRAGLFEYESNAPAWLKAFHRILQAQPEAWRSSGLPTVAQALRKMLRLKKGEKEWGDMATRLERAGLAVVVDGRGLKYLAIPPRHPAITKIFAQTDLQEHGGDGAWTTVLRNAPRMTITGPVDDPVAEGVYRVERVPRLPGSKCTLIWLDAKWDGERIFEAVIDDETDVLMED